MLPSMTDPTATYQKRSPVFYFLNADRFHVLIKVQNTDTNASLMMIEYLIEWNIYHEILIFHELMIKSLSFCGYFTLT